jgi:hypothetical protein
MDERELRDDFAPEFVDAAPATGGEPFACPIAVELWKQYRNTHPTAPATPPENPADMPDPMDPEADEYFLYASSCDDCNEV